MSRIKNILVIICTLLIFGCENNPKLHIISGYLYEDCSQMPLSNQYVELVQGIGGGLGHTSGGFLADGYTDSTGYFELAFEKDNNETLNLRDGSVDLLTDIPSNTDTKDLNIYKISTCDVQVFINVLNAYTEEDTLYMTNFDDIGGIYKLAGPFSSGFLYSTEYFSLPTQNYLSGTFTFRYNINGGQWASNWIDKDVDLKLCDGNSITVDIY